MEKALLKIKPFAINGKEADILHIMGSTKKDEIVTVSYELVRTIDEEAKRYEQLETGTFQPGKKVKDDEAIIDALLAGLKLERA